MMDWMEHGGWCIGFALRNEKFTASGGEGGRPKVELFARANLVTGPCCWCDFGGIDNVYIG